MFRYIKTCNIGVDLDKYREYQFACEPPRERPPHWFMQLLGAQGKVTDPGFIQVWFRGKDPSVRDIGTKVTYLTVEEFKKEFSEMEDELSQAFSDKEAEAKRLTELARIFHEEAEKKKRESVLDAGGSMPVPVGDSMMETFASSACFHVGDELVDRSDELLK